MNEDMDREWEEQLMSYARELPAERMPSALLEERTVRELRKRGLLRRKRNISMPWLAGSVAASLALFATGVVVGQYVGTRNTADLVANLRHTDASGAAAKVQQTGTAYVQALETLNTVAHQNRGSGQDAQAREVALTALHEAANQMVRLAPNDPVVAKILQGLEQESKQNQARTGKQVKRQIVWF
jgi:hypothetical protein